VYPQAREAGGTFVRASPAPRAYVPPGQARDPDRAKVEAGRRARRNVRRYCAAHRLNRLGTLTYAGDGCFDDAVAKADVGAFFRELRGELGGKPFPYLWVPEWHKNHGLHLHFAVGKYIRQRLLARTWGHGIVHIKLIGDVPVGAGSLGEARKAAGYLSKYVAKAFDDDRRISGRHRYEVAQGFQPEKVTLWARTADAALAQASEMFGGHPIYRWSSSEVEDWAGAPAVSAQWAG
jgi:hypothetical protein